MSNQIFDKVSGDMDFFKKIANKIPGFGGYIERQKRRDADKLLRESVALRIEKEWSRISAMQREFIGAGDIIYVDDLEQAAIKLRTFADRLRRAPRGYSGLFDAVKINEDELERIYAYDANFLDLIDAVSSAIDNVEASVGTDGLPASLRHLKNVSQSCIDAYDLRSVVVLGDEAV